MNNEEIDVLELKQTTLKLLMNSLYGCMSNDSLWFADIRIAQSITGTGRKMIIHIGDQVDRWFRDRGYGSVVIAGDTDSIYMSLDSVVKKLIPNETDPKRICKFLDQVFRERIQDLIDRAIEDIAKECKFDDIHREHSYLQMNREVIADVGLFKAKKMYCVRVYDKEGVYKDNPSLKIKGIELVKRNTPEIFKTKLIRVLDLILDQNIEEIRKIVKEMWVMVGEISAFRFTEIKPCDKINMYRIDGNLKCDKGAPIHYKGSLVYNELLKRLKLTEKYSMITHDMKVHVIKLKKFNRYRVDAICVPLHQDIPEEFKLNDQIDREQIFEDLFLNKVTSLLEVAGMNLVERINYENLI